MTNYYALDVGCCLTCKSSEDGCLCYDCNCTKCDKYNDNGTCDLAQQWKADNYNLVVRIKDDGYITIKFSGPINKSDYAKIKPFIQRHFNWDSTFQEYVTYSEDEAFIDSFTKLLNDCNFDNWDFEH